MSPDSINFRSLDAFPDRFGEPTFLASDDLSRLLDVRVLGGRAVDVVQQNYAMSIAVNAIGLVIGAGGGLSPVLAAVLHHASSVAVVANSSRLIRYELG